MLRRESMGRVGGGARPTANWDYETAFSRNRGLIEVEEQERLRSARVAIAGLGGVGGVHLVTLARLGIGRFTVADPDRFDVANTNRQYGATASTQGRRKDEVMVEVVRDVNPEVEIEVLPDPVGEENLEAFLRGVDVVVDGLDVFEIGVRRKLFRRAAELGIPAITAGPIGFSTAWILFTPDGMSFDRYFDLRDGMDTVEQFVAFGVGLVPRATHRRYLDLTHLDTAARTGPSVATGCQLAAGVVGAEVVKLLLGRGTIRPAPWYRQFDAYRGKLVGGRLRGGNRHPLQRLKRRYLTRLLRRRAEAAGRTTP